MAGAIVAGSRSGSASACCCCCLYKGRSSNKFGLLTGSIVSVDSTDLSILAVVAVVVIATLAVVYRPLLFASTDPGVAVARGVPVRALSVVFAVLIALTTVLAVLIAEIALLGGTFLSLAPGLPVSGYAAALSFLCYLACRLVGSLRGRATVTA